MSKIDWYVVSVMIFSACVMLFRLGSIKHRWGSIKKNERILDVALLAPYVVAIVSGIILLTLKEVVL